MARKGHLTAYLSAANAEAERDNGARPMPLAEIASGEASKRVREVRMKMGR